eukprot:4142995-Alexandrium_andersonii.AAC.1
MQRWPTITRAPTYTRAGITLYSIHIAATRASGQCCLARCAAAAWRAITATSTPGVDVAVMACQAAAAPDKGGAPPFVL